MKWILAQYTPHLRICENEILNFSRSYNDPLELKNTQMFVNTEISLTIDDSSIRIDH